MIINGKEIQEEIKKELATKVASLEVAPVLLIVYVGKHAVTDMFVALKERFGKDIGVVVKTVRLPQEATLEEVRTCISTEGKVADGVVVQLPLPMHLDEQEVLALIPPEKDVDVLSPLSMKALAEGVERVLPPVAGAVFEIAQRKAITFGNKKIVVVGAGKLVGLPLMYMFNNRSIPIDSVTLETSADEKTRLFREADVIISGAGDPHMIRACMVKKGVIVFDAGTSEKAGMLSGDVHPEVADVALWMTPVPGGIGPVTIAILFRNLINACSHT